MSLHFINIVYLLCEKYIKYVNINNRNFANFSRAIIFTIQLFQKFRVKAKIRKKTKINVLKL